eukprot:12929963-Prorocentrum_lima.AAC.1
MEATRSCTTPLSPQREWEPTTKTMNGPGTQNTEGDNTTNMMESLTPLPSNANGTNKPDKVQNTGDKREKDGKNNPATPDDRVDDKSSEIQ